MTATDSHRAWTKWSAGAAAVLALGGIASYVLLSGLGNQWLGAEMAGGESCRPSAEMTAAVDDARAGEVAAVLAAEDANDLSELAFKGPDGEAMTLADFSGKTVLVNLWATWCAPCREEMPALGRLQEARGGGDFEVLPISIDSAGPEASAQFLDEVGVDNLPLYHDQTTGVFNELRQRSLAVGLPATMIVDGQGCVVAKLNGPAGWDAPEALAMIDAIVGTANAQAAMQPQS